MPPKVAVDQAVTEALRALAEQDAQGPMEFRLESAVDRTTREAIDALAREFGGYGARSKAIRVILQEGAKALVAKRRRRA